MSLPDEEVRAMRWAHAFLLSICVRETKRVPKAVREEARRILRHYPFKESIAWYWRGSDERVGGLRAKQDAVKRLRRGA